MTSEHAAAPGRSTGGGDEISAGGRDSDTEFITDPYIDPADKLLMAALRAGFYVLAVRCRVCGAPLTAKRSRARGVGPQCGRGEAA